VPSGAALLVNKTKRPHNYLGDRSSPPT